MVRRCLGCKGTVGPRLCSCAKTSLSVTQVLTKALCFFVKQSEKRINTNIKKIVSFFNQYCCLQYFSVVLDYFLYKHKSSGQRRNRRAHVNLEAERLLLFTENCGCRLRIKRISRLSLDEIDKFSSDF